MEKPSFSSRARLAAFSGTASAFRKETPFRRASVRSRCPISVPMPYPQPVAAQHPADFPALPVKRMKDGVADHLARFFHCKYRRIFPQRALPEEGFRLFFVKRQLDKAHRHGIGQIPQCVLHVLRPEGAQDQIISFFPQETAPPPAASAARAVRRALSSPARPPRSRSAPRAGYRHSAGIPASSRR